jgi:hypothetical protein
MAYEVCFRAREGLPFATNHLMNLVIPLCWHEDSMTIKSIFVTIYGVGSHAHMLLVALDAKNFLNFLGETQKKTTEIIKRLLGLFAQGRHIFKF